MDEMFWTLLKEYFLLNTKQFFDGVDFLINIFILSISLGFAVAIFLVTAHKRCTSLIIKQLTRHNAYSEDTAVTLEKMRIKPSFLIRAALSGGGQITHIVKRVDEKSEGEEKPANDKIDFSTAKFFISEDKRDMATKINELNMPGYFNATIYSLIIITIALATTLFMHEILGFLAGL